jgi:hypothetical protein
MMYGLTEKSPERLLVLAKSWNIPPQLFDATGCQVEGYRSEERAYHLIATSKTLSFRVHASEQRPLFNPCFVIKAWNDAVAEAALKINGKEIPKGKDFRQGITRDSDGKPQMVIWVQQQSEDTTTFEISKRV